MSDRRECLRVIFRLESRKVGTFIAPDGSTFEIGAPDLTHRDLDGPEVFELVIGVLQRFGLPLEFSAHGKKPSLERLRRQIPAKPHWPPGITSNDLSLRYSNVTTWGTSFLMVEELVPGAARSWSNWVAPFLNSRDFVQAWTYDREYDYWQNAEQIGEYEAKNRPHAHLKKRSNNLRPPLLAEIIDTSGNPGRWTFKNGYIEAVGSSMWLGENFWARVGSDRREAVMAESFLNPVELPNGVIHISASDRCFVDETSAELQDRVRAALYGPSDPLPKVG